MKLKKCMKRISAILLAATMVVVALPNQPVVKADEDDFPDEILFPVSILDFPADNLLFECPMSWMESYDSYLDLTSQSIAGVNTNTTKGKTLVADTLESDPTSIYYRLPVYKEKTVDYIANRVKATMQEAGSANLAFNKPYVDGSVNHICASNYIRSAEWKLLDTSDTFYETEYTNNKCGITHYSSLGGSAVEIGSVNCLKGNYVGYIGGPTDPGTVTFKYKNSAGAGYYSMKIYYMTNESRDFVITMDNTYTPSITITPPINNSWDNPGNKPYILNNVYLKAGVNTITFSGNGTNYAPNLDRIEIGAAQTVADTTVQAESSTTYDEAWRINSAYAWDKNNTKNGTYVHIGWWNHNYTVKVNVPKAGRYEVDVYYKKTKYSWGDPTYETYKIYANGNDGNATAGVKFPLNNDMSKNPVTLSSINLNAGNNTITFDGAETDIDKFVLRYVPNSNFPLGNYADSKEKYNIDRNGDKIADYGFYDMATCYDYAYFMTANLYKYHPSINSAYGNYNNLVFHRVEQNGKNYYEFMADQIHNEGISKADYTSRINSVYSNLGGDASADEKQADLDRYDSIKNKAGRLIYNPTTRSIRNACDAEGNYVGPTGDEFETQSGFMFVCDGDDYNHDPDNHTAGEGIKKYPSADPAKNGDDGKSHNFNYTIRTHSRFVYKEGADQKFFFSGDDDVYVFVNGNLLVDLGGQHQQEDGSFNLDSLAEDPKYGLINGKAVDFDFFYMERHSTASNFWGKMSFKLKNDEVELQWPDEFDTLSEMSIPYGWVVDLNYKFSSMRELTTNKNITFSDEIGDVIGAKDFKLADEVKLKDDKKLIVTVKRAQADGSYVDEVKEFTFGDVHDFTAEEVNAVKKYFADLALEQDDSVELSGLVYDTAQKKFTDFDATEDSRVRQVHFETRAEYDAYMTMGGTNSVDDTVAIHSEIKDSVTVKVLIGALKVSTRIEGLDENFDIKKDLSAFGHFKINREETVDDPLTPDVNESIVYENEFQIAKGDNTIIFDADDGGDDPAPNTIYREALPKGTYKLQMDVDMLTGYTVSAEVRVNGETVAEISKGDMKIINGKEYTFESIFVEIDPKIEGGKWVYPEVEYILKAYREVNPLKDLT